MIKKYLAWRHKRTKAKQLLHWQRGYNYAAGVLLRNKRSPLGLEGMIWYPSSNDRFDVGIIAAINKLVELKVVKDDRI